MEQYSLSLMRESCDKYQDGRGCPCPAWVTQFNVDKNERYWDAAKLALNIYNQEEQKNFNLEKVCKLNSIAIYFCMTFRAKNAGTDECRLFRGVVDGLSDTVLLCEIMEADDIAILSEPVENYVEALSESKGDHSPYPRYNASTKSVYHSMNLEEFVAQKMSFIEQYRLERERQQKLAEEEEIRRLRKEIIPKAQPMPYFDRPFVPRR